MIPLYNMSYPRWFISIIIHIYDNGTTRVIIVTLIQFVIIDLHNTKYNTVSPWGFLGWNDIHHYTRQDNWCIYQLNYTILYLIYTYSRLSQVVEAGPDCSSAMDILEFALYHKNNDNVANIIDEWMILTRNIVSIL